MHVELKGGLVDPNPFLLLPDAAGRNVFLDNARLR
jgi:hypothetical protein